MNCGCYTHRTGFKLTKVIFSLKQDFCTLYSIRIVRRSSYIDTDVADQSAELLITMWFLSRWYDIISSDIRYNLVRVIWEIQTTRFIIVICIYTGMKMSVDMTIHELNHSVTVYIYHEWWIVVSKPHDVIKHIRKYLSYWFSSENIIDTQHVVICRFSYLSVGGCVCVRYEEINSIR